MEEPRELSGGQIGLGDIPRHHDLGADAHPSKKHLHLGRRRVLTFVKDDKRAIQGPAPHIREGNNLDDFTVGITADLIVLQKLMEGVVQWSEIGIDLGVVISGKKTQGFSRLYCVALPRLRPRTMSLLLCFRFFLVLRPSGLPQGDTGGRPPELRPSPPPRG